MNQLDSVRQRLQPAEQSTDTRWPQSVLNSTGHFSFEPDKGKRGNREHMNQQDGMNHSGNHVLPATEIAEELGNRLSGEHHGSHTRKQVQQSVSVIGRHEQRTLPDGNCDQSRHRNYTQAITLATTAPTEAAKL